MIRQIAFTIFGEPVPKGRPRFNKRGFAYTPKNTVNYKEIVVKEAKKAMENTDIIPKETPIGVYMKIYRPIPKSFTKKQRKLIEEVKLFPVTKPDIDNYVKAVLDGCNDIIFKDDSQVIKETSIKLYGEVPRVEVLIKY